MRTTLVSPPVTTVNQNLDVKASVRATTTAALAAYSRTGNIITASGNGAIAAVDGVTLIAADRLLLKDGAAGADNGIYAVTTVGTGSTPFVLTRTTDADASAKVTTGMFTFTEEGTVNAGSGFVLTTANPITLNTTALTFTQFTGAGEITAGNGLGKSGNTLSIDTAITVDKTTAQTLTNKTLTAPIISGTSVATFGVTAAISLGATADTTSGKLRITTATGDGSVDINHPGGARPQLSLYANGVFKGWLEVNSGTMALNSANDLVLKTNNGTTALTLTTGQAATFASTVDSTGYKVATVAGIDASITTGTLVGKTITVSKGIITAFA